MHNKKQLKCSMMIMGRIHRIVNAPLAHDYSSLYDFQNVRFVVVSKAIWWPYKMSRNIYGHSSEIRGLCLMKWPSKMLQNLSYFRNTKIHLVFIFLNYGKFWSISLGHFIKHKPLISEEWYGRRRGRIWKKILLL